MKKNIQHEFNPSVFPVNSLVKVTWYDIVHDSDDLTREEAEKLHPAEVVTYGVLIRVDLESVVIASTRFIYQDQNTDGEFRATTCIPRSVVMSIEELAITKPVKVGK
jgi:hypothetical protein